jgi:hypothetical protein
MTTANIQIKKILVGRGNTAVASTYPGVRGEIVLDTGLNTLRVYDGTTTGGTVLATSRQVAIIANLVANTSIRVGNVPPTVSTTGTLWYDSDGGRTYIRYANAWVDASPSVTNISITDLTANVTVDTAPPIVNRTGSLWWDTADGRLYLRYNNAWIDASPAIPAVSGIGATYASGAFHQLTLAEAGELITIGGGVSLFRLPQITADLLGTEFEFYFSEDAGQVHIQSYYTGVRATTDVFRGTIYVGVDNAATGKLHTATATTQTACDLFLGQHHARAGSYVRVKAIAFDSVGTWMFQGQCVGDTGQTPNGSDHPFQDYN